MQTKKRQNCLPVLLAVSTLTLLTTACASPPMIEYIHDVPAVSFPIFPPPDCVEYDETMDAVTMPLWYWQKIAEYKIDVDAVEKHLDRLRTTAAPAEVVK